MVSRGFASLLERKVSLISALDINKLLPEYLGVKRSTTILGRTLANNLANEYLTTSDHCFVDFLLTYGAKLTKEDENEFLALDPTHWAYKAAVIQRGNDFRSFNRKE